jgi:hypothetical protein
MAADHGDELAQERFGSRRPSATPGDCRHPTGPPLRLVGEPARVTARYAIFKSSEDSPSFSRFTDTVLASTLSCFVITLPLIAADVSYGQRECRLKSGNQRGLRKRCQRRRRQCRLSPARPADAHHDHSATISTQVFPWFVALNRPTVI